MDYGFSDRINRHRLDRMCKSGQNIIKELIRSQNEIDKLWVQQAVNEFNNMDYREFMKRYSFAADKNEKETTQVKEEANMSKKETQIPKDIQNINTEITRTASKHEISQENNSMSETSIDMGNAPEDYQKQLKIVVFKRWQEIQRDCRKLDMKNTGSIPGDEFVGILDRMDLILPINEARDLIKKYEAKPNSGLFDYKNFLRHFILTLKPREDGLLRRRKLQNSKIKVETGGENEKFVLTLLSLRESVLQCWKEMRRTFRSLDINGEGFVTSSQFKHVLLNYSINLSNEDYFHLMSYYDYNLQDRIPYNEFIRVFLQ